MKKFFISFGYWFKTLVIFDCIQYYTIHSLHKNFPRWITESNTIMELISLKNYQYLNNFLYFGLFIILMLILLIIFSISVKFFKFLKVNLWD
jgi:hypothetical protein